MRVGAPPILTIHGEKDDEIPLSQAQILDAKMKTVGATHVLLVKRYLGHTDFTQEPEVLDFMDKYLSK